MRPPATAVRPRRLRRIGVAYDGSPESEVALAHAELLAHQRGCDTVARSRHPGLVALSREVDLLVCGSRRNGRLRRLVLGSTSDYLVRHVDVPLIITAPVDSSAVARWQRASSGGRCRRDPLMSAGASSTLTDLGRDECLRLLSASTVGRVVVVRPVREHAGDPSGQLRV